MNNDRSLILTTASRYLLPLMLLFSLFILFRGHNEPGGGFIGGLIAASGYALFGFACGMDEARTALRVPPRLLIGFGLLTAVFSGLIPVFALGEPFLTAMWAELELPAIGKPGTPLLFDIGVYLTVIGVTMLIIFTVAEGD